MSTPPNDGGPAFPQPEDEIQGIKFPRHHGMTLRDYFAGKALAGLMAQEDPRVTTKKDEALEAWRRENALEDAIACYRAADAMLVAREAK